ncbi:hypothetical protein [Cupriavidus sp. H18C2]|uniref:hypothetical protein n=1 Tax=Cupriavidus sp. H18C2 TaxID=3241602 RepID=UPI003BF8C0CF
MIRRHMVPVIVAAAVGVAGAFGAGTASAASANDGGRHPAKPSHPSYNIDQPRDPFTQGARFEVTPATQGRLILTGRDLTGVSAPPGGAPA